MSIGARASPVDDPELQRLRHTVERAVRSGSVLGARLAIERSLLTEGEARSFDRTSARLLGLRSSAAAHLARTLPHQTTAVQLIEQLFDSLRIQHVRVRAGGDNSLLSETFLERRPRPGLETGPRAYWVDCDLLAVTAWAVLEELQQRRPLTLPRLAIVATSDHLALAIRRRDPGESEEESIQVVLLRVLDEEGRLAVGLVSLSDYRDSYRRRYGETPRVLAPQEGLIANAWEIAASHWIARKEFDPAERYAARAVEIDPHSPGALNSLALARRRNGDLGGALESLSRAIALRGDDPHLFANLASVYLALGHHELALRAAESAVAHGPGEPLVYKRRFSVLTLLGDADGARRDLMTYQGMLRTSDTSAAP